MVNSIFVVLNFKVSRNPFRESNFVKFLFFFFLTSKKRDHLLKEKNCSSLRIPQKGFYLQGNNEEVPF